MPAEHLSTFITGSFDVSTISVFFPEHSIGQILPSLSVIQFLPIILLIATVAFFLFRERKIKKSARIFQDKTAEKIAQLEAIANEERKARLDADQSSVAKSVFLATMSHEIRTPMNGVLGMAALLKQTSLTSEQKEYADTIQSCGESLLTVINDILDFSKIEAGKMEVERSDFNLRTCIEEVLDIFANKANKSGIDLSYQIDLKVPTHLIGDSLRLRQVLINLVGNAIKFTQQGEIFIGVDLRNLGDKDAQIGFVVRDTGIGIPLDKLNRLFKSFSQVDSSTTRKYGGTGLGLAICEKLVVLMGGNISVQSEVGKGSEFSFSVSVGLNREAKEEASLNTECLVGKKVLLVGENSSSFSVIRNNLQELKSIAEQVVSGKQGLLTLFEGTDFDLIIADMQMKDMDGMQFASRVRQEHATLPIILLSGLGDDKPKGRLETYCSIVNKPVKPNTLIKQMIRLINQEDTQVSETTKQNMLSSDFSKRYPLNILIAEDNTVNQKLAERVLNKLGYKPDKALNGEEAYRAHEKVNYDLILMDVQMPVMDGFEATRKIRSSPQRQPVIVATTANAMAEDRHACLEAGMDDYLSKPIKFEELIKTLEKWAPLIKNNNVRAA